MKLVVLILLNFLVISSPCFAQDRSFGFDSRDQKIAFLERILESQDLNEDDLLRFREHTNFEEKVASLPWSFTADWYRFIRGASMLFQLHTIFTTPSLEVPEGLRTIYVDGVQVTNPGVAITEIAEFFLDVADAVPIVADFYSIFGTNPGEKIRLLSMKYEIFISLFRTIEIIESLHGDIDNHSSLLLGKAVSESVLLLTHASRQIAGLKMVTGGEVVAYNLEALIAVSLLELDESLRNSVLSAWSNSYEKTVRQEVGWFFDLTGERKKVFQLEVETLMNELVSIVENPEAQRKIRSGTFTHNAGVLMVGLLQENFRNAELALEAIENAEKNLKSLGIEDNRLKYVLAPISGAAGFTRKAIDNTALWTLSGVSMVESFIVDGTQYVGNGLWNGATAVGSGVSQGATMVSSTVRSSSLAMSEGFSNGLNRFTQRTRSLLSSKQITCEKHFN